MYRQPIAKHHVAATFVALVAFAPAVPAHAAGEIQITHAKALAGNVTAGDAPGYPVTLSRGGTYELGSDLAVTDGKVGIQVTTAGVTIDLNGFTLHGRTGASIRGTHGIAGTRENVVVRNGSIINFRYNGIVAKDMWAVENVRLLFNGLDGVNAGHFLRIENSLIYRNGRNGATSFNWATLRDSTVVANIKDGFVCDSHCLVEGNMIAANEGDGLSVALATILGNTINGNFGFGINGSASGYGNNTLLINNSGGGGAQVSNDVFPLHPNYCFATCP
jgi:hypothetical protein